MLRCLSYSLTDKMFYVIFIWMVLFTVSSCARSSESYSLASTQSNRQPVCQLQLECSGSTDPGTGRVRVPIRSARGPSGSVGERGPAGPPGPSGAAAPLPTWASQRSNAYQVAFYAGLSRSIEKKPSKKECPLIFDTVLLNMGEGYNATTGQFTAPVSGVYVFVLVVSAQSYEKAGAQLLHNGKVALLLWCESTFWATVTNQAILQLQKGDTVWLQCRDEAYRLHGYMYSNLSGYLIYPIVD